MWTCRATHRSCGSDYGDTGDGTSVPSPDGRYLAMLDSATESNIWMMEDF